MANSKGTKYAAVVLGLALVQLLYGCGPGAVPTSGFRVVTDLIPSAFNQPCTGAGVPGVFVSGALVTVLSPPGPGTQTEVSGLTNAFGILDAPNAVTNATWNFNFDWGQSACPFCFSPPLIGIKIFSPPYENLVCDDCGAD